MRTLQLCFLAILLTGCTGEQSVPFKRPSGDLALVLLVAEHGYQVRDTQPEDWFRAEWHVLFAPTDLKALLGTASLESAPDVGVRISSLSGVEVVESNSSMLTGLPAYAEVQRLSDSPGDEAGVLENLHPGGAQGGIVYRLEIEEYDDATRTGTLSMELILAELGEVIGHWEMKHAEFQIGRAVVLFQDSD